MKIVLSRKGVDSCHGGIPSPILPDGTMVSIPIPGDSPISYSQIRLDDHCYADIVEDLTGGRISGDDRAHLDPDLRREAFPPRLPGWRPIFGQRGSSQSHLRRCRVSSGDLFLFFGWFRRVECRDGHLRFAPEAPDLHVLFGWLHIGQVLNVKRDRVPAWARYHPHIGQNFDGDNAVYISRERLNIGGNEQDIPGAGAFQRYHDELCLTAPGRRRTFWRLPPWFHPDGRRSPLTYHVDPRRWKKDKDHVFLQSTARGQEFVLDADCYPEAIGWARGIIAGAVRQLA